MKETVYESLDLMLDVFEKSKGNKGLWRQQFANPSELQLGNYEFLINEVTNFNYL